MSFDETPEDFDCDPISACRGVVNAILLTLAMAAAIGWLWLLFVAL